MTSLTLIQSLQLSAVTADHGLSSSGSLAGTWGWGPFRQLPDLDDGRQFQLMPGERGSLWSSSQVSIFPCDGNSIWCPSNFRWWELDTVST